MSDSVPDGWKAHDLGDLAKKIEGGGTPPRDVPEYWNGGIPWATVKDLKKVGLTTTQEFISEHGLSNSSSKLIPANTMIIATRMAVGKAVFFNKDVAINQDLKAFHTNGNVDWCFLLHWYLSKSDHIESLGTGSTVKGIRLEDLKILPLLLPPLPEQQKIAAILSSVDDVIEKTQAHIDKLSDLKTGMMQELLTKGIGPGGAPHTEFKDSPVGRIPVGWDVVRVRDIQSSAKYSCVGGPFGSDLTSKHYIAGAGVPVIRGANLPLDFRKFTDSGFVYVSNEKAETLKKNMAYPGDLVFTQRGTMGQVGLIPMKSRFDRYVVSQSQMKLTVDKNVVDTEYLYQYFLSDIFLKMLELETIATGLPHINLGILKGFQVSVPPLKEQVKIAEILSSLDVKMAFAIKRREKYANTKKALMQDLLTGKVRVTVD